MPKLSDTAVPAYCHHRGSGQAVVTLNGRDFYLGKFNTAASKAEYNRLIGEWIAAGRTMAVNPQAITVGEVVVSYLAHAKGYYRRKDGSSTGEVARIQRELTPLTKLYRKVAAIEFGPLRLKAVREAMVAAGWVRTSINHATGTVKRCFRWAAENELIPASVFHGLQAVTGLKIGRSDAHESEPVKPVPMAHVEAVLPHVLPTVASMIRLQLLTGMRSGEMVIMRGVDLDTTGRVWVYKPQHHKTSHHGHERMVYLGRRAQQIIRPFLKPDLTAYLFNPGEADNARLDERQTKRRTPLSCGNRPGRRRREYGDHYTNESYRRAVARGCEAAFPPPEHLVRREKESVREWKARLTPEQRKSLADWRRGHSWHPHQLRHNFATEMRKQYGAESVLTLLGDRSTRMVDIYAEKNLESAMKIMAEVG